MRTLTFATVAVLLSIAAGAKREEPCGSNRDCQDAGTTCSNGRCTCWSDIGVAAAQAWVCKSGRQCNRFNNNGSGEHVCAPTSECTTDFGKNYCQPLAALKLNRRTSK